MQKLNSRSGAILYLVLSCVLTLLVISTAILLNNLYKSTSVPTSAILKADYQIESAIVMQMQLIKSEPGKDHGNIEFTREISPGYRLYLKAEQKTPKKWKFDVTVAGPGFVRSATARSSLDNPDHIVYIRN
ncbi:MAG: hypothetical protein Kow0029_13900 [Candidatus Rifleibacteriota bacterium]